MRKRKATKSEAAGVAFAQVLAALERYCRHPNVYVEDVNRLMAAVVTHRQNLPVTASINVRTP